jgi:CNT family concentrative nucleoside transporter
MLLASDPLANLNQGLGTPLLERAVGVLGIATILGIAWLMSNNRKAIDWRLVASGLALQAGFGLLVLKTAPGHWFFKQVSDIATGLLSFVVVGARFCFGYLVDFKAPDGIDAATAGLPMFAFAVLPAIIFVSSLMSVLYYLGIMQLVVKGVAWVMQRTLRTSGAETLSASGNIFIGQTEAPLLVKPFIVTMTSSELFTVMVGGFATVAGGVLVAYVAFLQQHFPTIAGHLLAASVMNAPAGLFLSKIIYPETEVPVTRDSLHIEVDKTDSNVIGAAASGASTGMQLAINVAGMLIAFVALIAMLNFGIGWAGGLFGVEGVTLQSMLGRVFQPLAWVMGVPWHETQYVGSLIGIKMILTELVAYTQLGTDLAAGVQTLSPRSMVITAYALLGFANIPSIAIQIGGIGGLAPERREELSRVGLRAMIAGNLAAFVSACWVGMLL